MASIQTKQTTQTCSTEYRYRVSYPGDDGANWEYLYPTHSGHPGVDIPVTEIDGIGRKTADSHGIEKVADILLAPNRSTLWYSSCRAGTKTVDELLEYAQNPVEALKAALFWQTRSVSRLVKDFGGVVDPHRKVGIEVDMIEVLVNECELAEVEFEYETKEYLRGEGQRDIVVTFAGDIKAKFEQDYYELVKRAADSIYITKGAEDSGLLGKFDGEYAFLLAPSKSVDCESNRSRVPTFNYMGAKNNHHSWILDHFPNHDIYVEAFGGSAGVMANKPLSSLEVYNDINDHCVDFFRVIKNRSDELREWLRKTPYSSEIQNEYVNRLEKGDYKTTIEKVGMWHFTSFATRACLQGKGGKSFRRSLTDKNPISQTYRKAVSNLEKTVERFRDVLIENMDYVELVEKYDAEETLIYFDPPYLENGDAYYDHDGDFDHFELLEVLEEMDGKWVVSYGEQYPDKLDELVEVSVKKTNVTSLPGQAKQKTERLFMNFDPQQKPDFTGERDMTIADL